jgi:hypothetical protein
MATILYSFSFMKNSSPNNYVFEIKYTGLPDNTPKEQKYQWFVYEDKQLSKLAFKSMSDNFREFQDESLLDMSAQVFTKDKNSYDIEKCTDEDNQVILSLLN